MRRGRSPSHPIVNTLRVSAATSGGCSLPPFSLASAIPRVSLFRTNGKMGSPIPLPGGVVVPKHKWALLPETDGADSIRLDSGSYQVISRCPGSPITKRKIILTGAALVGVTFDGHLGCGV